MSAISENKCDGCRHQHFGFGGWCYMFEQAPANLPCKQHYKYEVEVE